MFLLSIIRLEQQKCHVLLSYRPLVIASVFLKSYMRKGRIRKKFGSKIHKWENFLQFDFVVRSRNLICNINNHTQKEYNETSTKNYLVLYTYAMNWYMNLSVGRSQLLNIEKGRRICCICCVSAKNWSSFNYWTRGLNIFLLQGISLQSLHLRSKDVIQYLQIKAKSYDWYICKETLYVRNNYSSTAPTTNLSKAKLHNGLEHNLNAIPFYWHI